MPKGEEDLPARTRTEDSREKDSCYLENLKPQDRFSQREKVLVLNQSSDGSTAPQKVCSWMAQKSAFHADIGSEAEFNSICALRRRFSRGEPVWARGRVGCLRGESGGKCV